VCYKFQIVGMNTPDNGPPPAKQNIEFTPGEPKEASEKPAATKSAQAASSAVPQPKDAYGSIKETMGGPEDEGDQEEDDCTVSMLFYLLLFCVASST